MGAPQLHSSSVQLRHYSWMLSCTSSSSCCTWPFSVGFSFFCVVQNSSLHLILGFCFCMIFAFNLPYLSSVSPSAFEQTDVTKQQKKKELYFQICSSGTSYPWDTGTWVSLMLKSSCLRRFSLLGALERFGWLYNAAQIKLPPTGSPHLCWVELLTWFQSQL